MRVAVLYQDEDLVVIDKPAGIPTHAVQPHDPYAADALRTVQAQLGLAYLGIHQRLDAETSGVLLFSARAEANAALASVFAAGAVEKVYLALVHGVPRQPMGTIDLPISRAHGERYRVARPGERGAQRASTRYRLLETGPARQYSLLEVRPETGRSHQIRLHLAHAGIPVVGDPLYGPGGLVPARLGLHAYRLALPHPRTGERMQFTAPVPPLFNRLDAGLPELALARTWEVYPASHATAPGLRELIELAVTRRQPLAADPNTTIYRLVNGAADGLRGLVVDRYGAGLVVSVYDEGDGGTGNEAKDGNRQDSEPRAVAPGVVEALLAVTGATTAYLKHRPRQASRISEQEAAGLAPAQPAAGPPLGEYPAHEDGLTYLVRPGEGWNPGLFPDMREMRGRARAWSAGKRVLNCFAYTCGFGLAALAGGAERVLNLDLSRTALQRGQANYLANGFAPDPYDFVYGDAFDWLRRLARRGDRFDVVIVDPPGFATTKSRRFSAERDYGELAGLAAGVTAPGGLLIAACNVAGLRWRAFRDRVLGGLAQAGRAAEMAGAYHAPAIDFPTVPGRESYLKILVARLA